MPSLRQIELVVHNESREAFEKLLEEESVSHYWQQHSETSGYQLKALVESSNTEQFLDRVEQLLGSDEQKYRLVMFEVEATLPRMEREEPEEEESEEAPRQPWEKPLQGVRVSREELYTKISDAVVLSKIYMAMVVLSTIVAALGILRDNTAVVIGAMVIAPLLGPNVGLALSTTLADFKLAWTSLKTNVAGLLVALLISIVIGFLMGIDIDVYQIASRTEVHLSDISLALASGAAGVLAYTVGMSAAVIGVMVAVALLPPLVTAGLLIGDMQFELAFYAFLLLLTNIICVNLAAVSTFLLQGVRPRTWYETAKANRINRVALTLWIFLVVILALLIYY
ncbi:MAG: TIGR00341 family protein, partial [Balneolaceae bacterium]